MGGGERVVACVDLRESLGESKETFKNNFMGENILPHNKDFATTLGYNYQAKFTTFESALLYILDRNAEYRETFGKRGTIISNYRKSENKVNMQGTNHLFVVACDRKPLFCPRAGMSGLSTVRTFTSLSGNSPQRLAFLFNCRKFDNRVKMQGTSGASSMCAFSDARAL